MSALAALVARAAELRRAGSPRQAARIAELALRRARHDAAPARTRALILAELGVALKESGRLAGARVAYTRALALVRRPLDRAALLHDQSGLAHAAGELAVADRLLRRAIRLRERHAPRARVALAREHAALAVVWLERGRLRDASARARAALRTFARALGPDDVECAHAAATVAAIATARGRLADADRGYRRAIALGRARLGAAHPDVALWRQNYAVVCARRGDRAGARRHLAAAHRALVAALGPRHPFAVACRRNAKRLA